MRFFKQLPLKWKNILVILVVSMLTTSVGLAIGSYIVVTNYKASMVQKVHIAAKLTAKMAISEISFGHGGEMRKYLMWLKEIPDLKNARIYTPDNNLYSALNSEDTLPQKPKNSKNSWYKYDDDYLHLSEPMLQDGKYEGFLYIRIGMETLDNQIFRYLKTTLIILVLLFFLSYFFASFFQKVLSRPILHLAQTAQKVTQTGNYGIRIKKTTSDEIGKLYDQFNSMLEQIQTRQAKLKEANSALSESKEKFKKISSSANDAIIVIDNTQNIVFWNRAATKIFGYTKEEILTKPLVKLLPNNRQKERFGVVARAMVQQNATEKNPSPYEMLAIRKDKKTIDIELTASKIEVKQNNHWVTIIRDITDRKIAQQKLKDATEKAIESEKLKSAFLQNISHEIRTPMNGIMGFAGLLKDPMTTQKELHEYAGYIVENGENLILLIDDIVDISKIGSEQMTLNKQTINLTKLLKDIYITQNKQKKTHQNSRVKLILNETLLSCNTVIDTDPDRLKQVFFKLLSNAIKFTERGVVEFGYEIIDNKVQFFVSDTGIGIEKQNYNKIFETFSKINKNTSKLYCGTGLGLAISKSIINLLGGDIWVESEVGKGSIFYFWLPLSA